MPGFTPCKVAVVSRVSPLYSFTCTLFSNVMSCSSMNTASFVIPAPLMLPLPFADAIPGRAQTMIRTNIIASDFFIFFPSFKITLI